MLMWHDGTDHEPIMISTDGKKHGVSDRKLTTYMNENVGDKLAKALGLTIAPASMKE